MKVNTSSAIFSKNLRKFLMGRINNERYPYSIVWTPIPMISWVLPFVGHIGICSKSGIIRDFAGPYTVQKDDMGFGWPTRVLKLDPSKIGKVDKDGKKIDWDFALRKVVLKYKKLWYDFFCRNCHNMVADFLNEIEYEGRKNWGVVEIAARLFLGAKFVSTGRTLYTIIPFLIAIFFFIMMYAFGIRLFGSSNRLL